MGIKAIGKNIAHKVATPFAKKSMSSNPFENNSFKGKAFNNSVLPFADVFQTNKSNVQNRMKMISSSVIGAVSSFGHKITQPIVNFARNMKMGIDNTVNSIKSIPNRVHEASKNMSERISENINRLRNIGAHDERTESGVKILNIKHINENASVEDLKATWLNENELETTREVA